MQYEKRNDEKRIVIQCFDCTNEVQYRTGALYWRLYRTIIANSYPS